MPLNSSPANPLPCDVVVTTEWLTPHFLPRKDKPYELAMSRAWTSYMTYEDYDSIGMWSSRIVGKLFDIPRALNERGSRVAMTFAIWLMTPIGETFLKKLFLDQKMYVSTSSGVSSTDYNQRDVAIRSWASENSLLSLTNNTLDTLLRDSVGAYVYKDQPYPTLEDSRVIEEMCCFFVSKEGRYLLRKVYKNVARRIEVSYKRNLPFNVDT